MLEQGGLLGAVIGKFGLLKVLGFGASLLGAGMMAIFRPPRTRKELFLQGAVALGTSLLLGGTIVDWVDYYVDFIDIKTASLPEIIQFNVTIHGLLGAFSWGLFGGIAVLRDKFGSDPVKTAKDVKDAVS